MRKWNRQVQNKAFSIPVVCALEELQMCLVDFQMFGHGFNHLVELSPLGQRQDESPIVGNVLVDKVDLNSVEQVSEVLPTGGKPVLCLRWRDGDGNIRRCRRRHRLF